MPCPYCGAALADGARLCTACGRLIAPRQPGQPTSSAPTAPVLVQPGQSPTVGPRAVDQPGPSYGSDPYGPFFDPASLPPETAATWRQHRFHATFSVLLLILVHFLTFGMASPFLVARKYTFLPVIRRDDFSTAKAAGFLFIPFFGLYWVFVVSRRLVDRLTLQARLWSLPGAPSKGLAAALAICWVTSAIPYLGLLFWVPLQFALWPIYLAQIQQLCNRLAIEAAPPEVRAPMLALERAMRLRWIGWIVIVPCLIIVATSLVTAVVAPPGPILEMVVGTMIVLVVAGGGGVLLYLGERGTGMLQDGLESSAPSILAGYLRIDKNAAWSVASVAIPAAIGFVLAGVITLTAPTPTTPRGDAWPSIALGAVVGVGAAYAVLRALQLKLVIARLTEMRPSPADSGPASW
jgi:hypothetical protein